MTAGKVFSRLIILFFSAALAACGGGSSGGGGDPPIPSPDFSNFSDVSASELAVFSSESEYQNQQGLDMINAAWVYARGVKNRANGFGLGTGEGVTIGIIDSGLDHSHPDFNAPGKVNSASSLSYVVGYPNPEPGTYGVLDISRSEVQDITRYPTYTITCTELVLSCDPDDLISATPDDIVSITRDVFVNRLDNSFGRLPAGGIIYLRDDGTEWRYERGAQRGEPIVGSELYHGTSVSAIAAGAKGAAAGIDAEDNTHGVAYNAHLLVTAIEFPEISSPTYTPVNLSNPSFFAGQDNFFASLANYQNRFSDVVNMSFGYQGQIDRYTRAQVRGAFGRFIAAMAQAGTDPADRTIYVASASNNHRAMFADGRINNASSPGIVAGFPLHAPELRGHYIAAVAVVPESQGGGIADFSNRCGTSKEWCLAAPGVDILAPFPTIYEGDGDDPSYDAAAFRGTSAAAPHVAGALAILIDFFNGQLGHTEIVTRVFATANKSGIYANEDIYGQGLLDLKRATEPFGATRLLTSRDLGGAAQSAVLTRLFNSGAFGDAWQRAFARQHVIIFDELDAPFPVPLADFVSAPRLISLTGILARLGDDDLPSRRILDNGVEVSFMRDERSAVREAFFAQGGWRLGAQGSAPDKSRRWFAGYHVHPGYGLRLGDRRRSFSPARGDEFLAPYMSFAAQGISLGAVMPLSDSGFALSIAGFHGHQAGAEDVEDETRAPVYSQGGVLSFALTGDEAVQPFQFGVQLGLVNETEGLAGSHGAGALEIGQDMQTWFAGLTAVWHFGAWHGQASAYAGITQPDIAAGSLFREMSALWTTAMSIGLMRRHLIAPGDQLSFFITQPLRVERGEARLDFATARTRYREVIAADVQADLEPSGREIEIEASYLFSPPFSLASFLPFSSRCALALSYIYQPGHNSAVSSEARAMMRWHWKI